MRFRKVVYNNQDAGEINLNVSQRVEYFLHYWNFLFQNNYGLLLIHQEKFESHRSLFRKLETQIIENKIGYAKRIEPLLLDHPYFQDDNLLIQKSPKTKEKINSFKDNFRNNWFDSKKKGRERNIQFQEEITKEFVKIKKGILRNYLKRLIRYLINQLSQDKPINQQFKMDIHFLSNAVIVELYSNGYSIDYIEKISSIIVFPKENKNLFPFDKTYYDFNNSVLFEKYKTETLEKINLQEQIACLGNFIDNSKYPKQNGHCVFNIADINYQLEEPITIWGVTFYNPQKTKKIKLDKIYDIIEQDRESDFESIEIDFNHFIDSEQNKLLNSTCNALIKVNYRMFDRDNPVLSSHLVISKIDKALQVLKKLKLNFVNGNGSVLGQISTSKCIFLDEEFNYRQFILIQNDKYPFSLEEYQKPVFAYSIREINKLLLKNKKLIDLYTYLCQAETDEFAFNFKDFWTVVAEANFPNNAEEFIKECQRVFRKELNNRLFMDTKIFLNNSLFRKSLNLPASEYLLKDSASKRIGLNIPEKRSSDARKFESNFHKLKIQLEFEFQEDILNELNECQKKPEKHAKKIDKWLNDTIWSAYAERNLETHNNIATDYSLIKLKRNFLYIGEIFLHSLKNKL